jgi:hypothetical protein
MFLIKIARIKEISAMFKLADVEEEDEPSIMSRSLADLERYLEEFAHLKQTKRKPE